MTNPTYRLIFHPCETLAGLYNLQSFFLRGHAYHKVLKLAKFPENHELKLLHATF